MKGSNKLLLLGLLGVVLLPSFMVVATPATGKSVPLPAIALNKGDFYFSIDGRQSLFFSRNGAAYHMNDFDTLIPMMKKGGTTVVRLTVSTIVAGGTGYTNSGKIDTAWAGNWERVFDIAEANGMYIWVNFTYWGDWNTTGHSNWERNPFNSANGGLASEPAELFKKDSITQELWLQWLKRIVSRWQDRKNILAWESYSEVNLTHGVSEKDGLHLVERAAAVIREADSFHRPLTLSLADTGVWPSILRSDAADFINIHPYPPSAQLDRTIILNVRQALKKYDKPVLIGESGLNADSPEKYPPNAEIGVRHAVWAGVVSGAANARALFWEDGFGIYFPSLSWPFLRKYADTELPAANFVRNVDFAGFKPLTVIAGDKVIGAAVGNERSAIGWFRDTNAEPPLWNISPVISHQSVRINIPGSASTWRADFYNTKTGAPIGISLTVTRKGNNVTVELPDFTDDIAFKMDAQ